MPSKPSPSPRDKHLTELVCQTGRHLAFSRLLQLATQFLDRDEAGDLATFFEQDDLAMVLYRDLINNNDPLPCPDAFVKSLHKGFIEGIAEARNLVRKTLR